MGKPPAQTIKSPLVYLSTKRSLSAVNGKMPLCINGHKSSRCCCTVVWTPRVPSDKAHMRNLCVQTTLPQKQKHSAVSGNLDKRHPGYSLCRQVREKGCGEKGVTSALHRHWQAACTMLLGDSSEAAPHSLSSSSTMHLHCAACQCGPAAQILHVRQHSVLQHFEKPVLLP